MQINPRLQMHLLLWAYSICRTKRQHQVVQLRIMCMEYTQVTLEQRGKRRRWYRPTTLYWTQHRALTFLRLNKHMPRHLEPMKDLHWQYLSSQLVLHLWVKPIRQVPIFHGPLISLVIQIFVNSKEKVTSSVGALSTTTNKPIFSHYEWACGMKKGTRLDPEYAERLLRRPGFEKDHLNKIWVPGKVPVHIDSIELQQMLGKTKVSEYGSFVDRS